MNLLNFIKNFFKPASITEETPAVAVAAAKPRKSRYTTNGHWVQSQLKDYDGLGLAIVKVPRGLSMEYAQTTVVNHIAKRFGQKTLRTQRFNTARTIHIRPRVTK